VIPPEEHGPSLEAGRLLLVARRPELAEPELRRFLAAYPHSPHGQALLGWCLALLGRAKEAVEAGQEAVRLAPDWSYTHASLAEVYLQLGWNRDAERSAREALALDPNDPRTCAVLSGALFEQRWRRVAHEALRAADDGLALDPEHAWCARVRALSLSRLKRHHEAREAAAYALRLEPNEALAHAAAGQVELAAGARPGARGFLRQALRLDPANEYAKTALLSTSDYAREAAGLLVQAERWSRPLRWIAAVFATELGIVLARANGFHVFIVLVTSAFVLLVPARRMLWARRRHPALVEEVRRAGGYDIVAPESRLLLVLYIVLLLLTPMLPLLALLP
jgi:tetratricopeptide (TPR) repeat protein